MRQLTELPVDEVRQRVDDRRMAGAERVTEGYGILQPRVSISLPGANRSRYARLHGGGEFAGTVEARQKHRVGRNSRARSVRRGARGLNGGHQQADQDGDDSDYDQ